MRGTITFTLEMVFSYLFIVHSKIKQIFEYSILNKGSKYCDIFCYYHPYLVAYLTEKVCENKSVT